MSTSAQNNPVVPMTSDLVNAIVELTRRGLHPAQAIEEGQEAPAMLWPDKSITDLEHLLARPATKRGHAELSDVASFIDYVNRHKTAGTVLVGDYSETGGWFRSVLDHHTPHRILRMPPVDGELATSFEQDAGWSEHTAKVVLQPTTEWVRWLGKAGKALTQQEFAEFIEDNSPDVVVPEDPLLHGVPVGTALPSSADLMQVALTLQVSTEVRFNSVLRLSNGSTQLAFSENVNGSYGAETKLTVPDLFTIGIAPFVGAPKFVVQIRLRYRSAGGKATFSYQLVRPHKIVATAWEEQRGAIETAVGVAVLRGDVTPQKREAVRR